MLGLYVAADLNVMSDTKETKMDPKQHPAWDVYDQLRTARLNVKYYSARLACLQRRNMFMEIVLAISAPTSAIAGLWFWSSPIGNLIWKCFGVLAAFIAGIKPFLKITEKIKSVEETLIGYRTLDHDLQNITIKIRQKACFDKDLQKEFQRALERKRAISTKEPELQEMIQLKEKCEEETLKELPHSNFFIPEV